MSSFKVVVVTPEKTAFDAEAEFVALPLIDGEIGVLTGHAPTIGRLGFGEMRVRDKEQNTSRYYVDGGFVQISDNVVSVLTSRAIASSDLDATEIRQRLDDVEKNRGSSLEEEALRRRRIAQAKIQLKILDRA